MSGLGKSGHVGRKIAATLSSTGTSSIFLHPSEALHGDFGMISQNDVLLLIAFGGQTREVLAVTRFAKDYSIPTIAITGTMSSALAKQADIVLNGSIAKEADSHNLAPTTSTTVALGLGDALAVALMEARNFQPKHFAKFHPGGSLGLKLQNVKDAMHHKTELEYCLPEDPYQEVVRKISVPNFGIIAVLNDHELIGAITDGDLRRAIVHHGQKAFHLSARDIMSVKPKIINEDDSVMDAISMMEQHAITSLFVGQSSFKGLIRLHDLLAAKVV